MKMSKRVGRNKSQLSPTRETGVRPYGFPLGKQRLVKRVPTREAASGQTGPHRGAAYAIYESHRRTSLSNNLYGPLRRAGLSNIVWAP